MIELQLQVDVPDIGKNGGITVWDRLVFVPGSTWKIDDFRIATGEKLIKGPSNLEPEDCIDRTGKVRLTIETYQGRDRNKVEAYIDPADAAEKGPKKVEPPSFAPPKAKMSLEQEFKAKGVDPDEDDIPLK